MRPRRADIAFTALTSLVAAIYFELFREAVNSFKDGDAIGLLSFSLTPSGLIVITGAFLGVFALLVLLQWQKRIPHALFTWRYPLAAVVLAALVVAEISGSSLALWDTLLGDAGNAELQGVLFGIPRSIRSDEFMVFTPMALSQEHTGYAAVSDLMRGVPTDLTLIYAQPSWALATLFRPFLWGYLVLGSAKGLSFFWCGRLIALFLVSFEFGRFISHDNRPAALAYAVLVSLSPLVQWWFSVNGTVELLVFAQGGVMAFGAFLRSSTRLRRTAFAALASYAAGCFVMVIYPAWQVSIAYVIVALCIADVVYCRTRSLGALAHGFGVRRAFTSYWLVLLCALAVVAALIGTCLLTSSDVIQAVSNSAYPGKRVETGGGFQTLLFDWTNSWLFPIAPDVVEPNACERASMFTLFPLGALLGAVALVKRRDPYVIALFAVGAFLLAFGAIGFPTWLAQATLLSNVTSQRIAFAFGLVNIMLLIRSATLLNQCARETDAGGETDEGGEARRFNPKRLPAWAIIAIALAFAALSTVMFQLTSPNYAFKIFLALTALLTALATCAVLAFAAGRDNAEKLACLVVVLALAGLCVNPVQQGTAALERNDIVQEAASRAESDPDALWAGSSRFAGQALITAGARALSSVAIYPDLDTWRAIDPAGASEDIYNRYAHITLCPTHEETSFKLDSPDSFTVHLNPDDAEKLGIDYWLADSDLTEFNTARTTFTPLYTKGTWTIYQVQHE